MRYVLGLVIACVVLQAVRSQGQTQPDQLTATPNDRLAAALWRIAATTNTRIGFEATDHVRMAWRITEVPTLSVSTLDASLDATVGADGRYEWRKLDGVVVVRPKGAWGDRFDPFNRQLRSVHVVNAMPGGVLRGLRDFIDTDKFAIDQRASGVVPVSFDVPSGTVVDVLNELMAAADSVMWIASSRPDGRSAANRSPPSDLSLEVRDANHLVAGEGIHHPRAQR